MSHEAATLQKPVCFASSDVVPQSSTTISTFVTPKAQRIALQSRLAPVYPSISLVLINIVASSVSRLRGDVTVIVC